jgi:cytochrome c-type protein NapC
VQAHDVELCRRYWDTIRRPSVHYSLGFLTLGGFIGGIVFWGAFNTAMEATNTEKFCTGCHEMRDNVFAELKSTIHYTNRSGVRATCSDCHVPHDWTDKMARKMQASKEVWGKIFGTIDTREKFRDKRLELAQHEWARFKANDSLEVPQLPQLRVDGLHAPERRAQAMHSTYLASKEKTCIDCHMGIAHRLPFIRRARRPRTRPASCRPARTCSPPQPSARRPTRTVSCALGQRRPNTKPRIALPSAVPVVLIA